MSLIDEHSTVLRLRNLTALHRIRYGRDEAIMIAIAVLRPGHVIELHLVGTPTVKMTDCDSLLEILRGDHRFELRSECHVEAQHENGLVELLRKPTTAIRKDQRFAGASDAMNDSVTFAEAPRKLLLMKVHDSHQRCTD